MASNSTQIGVGRGQAQVLDVPRATKYVDTKAQAQKAADLKTTKEQKTALDTIMDVDFALGWQEVDNQIQTQIDNYRNKIVGWSKQGGDLTDPDFQRVVKTEQDRIGLVARKSTEVKEIFKEQRLEFKSPLYNDQARQNLHNIVFDERGAKDIMTVDRQQFIDNANDSDGYNKPKVWEEGLKLFPTKIEKVFHEWNPNKAGTASQKDVTSWSGRLYKVIGEGKNQRTVIDIDAADPNDLSKQILMEHPMIKNIVEQAREAGVDEAKIWEQPIKILEVGLGEQKTTSTKGVSASSRGGLSQKDFDNAMKFKEQVTQVVQGATEFYNAKEVNRVRGRDLPMDSGSFVQDIDESGMYDVLYKVNAAGEQVILDIVDFSDMDEAREKIVRHMKFLQAPTASELEKTPPFIPEGKREEDLARSEWLFTDPTQFEVSEEEAASVKQKRDDALIEDSHKQLGRGDKGAEKLTEALKGKKYKEKTVDRVEKRGKLKTGWQIIHFTDGTQMVIGGQEGNEEVLDEIIRGGEAIAPTELTEGGLDDI